MNKKTYLFGAILLFAISSLIVRAQQETNQQADERVVTATNLVTVNVIVTDRNGRSVKGLERDQFAVYDEKVKQPITHFSTDADAVSLGIVGEIHNTTPEKTRAMLVALRQFTRSLRPGDDFFFMAFGTQGGVATDFVPTPDQLIDHLATVKPAGPSSLFDAVYAAADRLRKGRNLKKALLIVSDGEDNNSHTSYKELSNRLKEFDVQVYAIGIANPSMDSLAAYGRWVFEDITRQTGRRPFLMSAEASMGRAVLTDMTRVSGGSTYFPESENEPELVGICAQIARELREQYTIGFYASQTPARKNWHRILITLNRADAPRGLRLSYRKSYRLGVR